MARFRLCSHSHILLQTDIKLQLTSEDRGSGKHTGTILVHLMHDSDAAATAIEHAQQDIRKLTPGTGFSARRETIGMIEGSQPVTKPFEAGLSIIITKLDMIINIGDEVAKASILLLCHKFTC